MSLQTNLLTRWMTIVAVAAVLASAACGGNDLPRACAPDQPLTEALSDFHNLDPATRRATVERLRDLDAPDDLAPTIRAASRRLNALTTASFDDDPRAQNDLLHLQGDLNTIEAHLARVCTDD